MYLVKVVYKEVVKSEASKSEWEYSVRDVAEISMLKEDIMRFCKVSATLCDFSMFVNDLQYYMDIVVAYVTEHIISEEPVNIVNVGFNIKGKGSIGFTISVSKIPDVEKGGEFSIKLAYPNAEGNKKGAVRNFTVIDYETMPSTILKVVEELFDYKHVEQGFCNVQELVQVIGDTVMNKPLTDFYKPIYMTGKCLCSGEFATLKVSIAGMPL